MASAFPCIFSLKKNPKTCFHFAVEIVFIDLFLALFIICPHRVFIAVHGLSLVGVSGGCSPVAVHGLPIAVAFLVAAHGF